MGVFRSRAWWGTICRLGVVSLVMASLLLAGCASQYGRQTTVVQYYPECYAPIAKLRAEEKQFVTNVAAGAVIGALAGAVLGGAIGGGRGALIGAGAGLVAGAGVAAALTKYKQVKDDRQRRAYLSRDMAAEAATLDRVGLSAALASKCYREHFDQLLADYGAGYMSREEFQARALEIISGLNEIATITKSFNGEANLRLQQYQAMLTEEARMENMDLPPIEAVPMDEYAPPPPPITTPRRQKKKKRAVKKAVAAPGDNDQLLTKVKGPSRSGQAVATGPVAQEPTAPDETAMPKVIAKREANTGKTVSTAVGAPTNGPDPTTMPGVIARRDNYKAKVDRLTAVQQETTASVESCIAKAEAQGVEIPQSLRPKATS